MKKYIITISTILAIIGVLAMSSGPVLANDESYTVINEALSVTVNNPGRQIPQGSTIKHLENDTTEIYNANKSLVLKARDSEAKLITTPSGLKKATYVYNVPNKSRVEDIGNTIRVYDNETLILTIIYPDVMKSRRMIVPSVESVNYVEDGYDTGKNIDYFAADWVVPAFADSPSSTATNFLWIGVMPYIGGAVVQPVLEWNQGSSHDWTGRAWYADLYGGTTSATPIDVSEADQISGGVHNTSSNYWDVVFYDDDTSEFSSLTVYAAFGINPSTGHSICWVLESFNIQDDNDVPGDTTFTNISLKKNGSSVSFSVNEWINTTYFSMLSGKDVTWSGTSWVKLNTNN
jgi:hypothetical protein